LKTGGKQNVVVHIVNGAEIFANTWIHEYSNLFASVFMCCN